MSDIGIQTFALTKNYGNTLALAGLDLSVRKGEIFGFLGPNGSGKSTAIRILLDLIRPTSGRAEVHGIDCQERSLDVRALVGHLPGDVRLYPKMSGHQTVEYFGSLRRAPIDAGYANELAERLQLDLGRRSGELSKGNRQKLGILVALLAQPRVLIFDEPTSGLDPLLQHTVWSILREEAARGTTVFFSSHVMSEVEAVCERVGILRQGQLVEVAPVSQLKARSLQRFFLEFAETAPGDVAFALEGVRIVERDGRHVNLEVAGDVNPLIRTLARFDLNAVESRTPTLDEILLSFYQEGAAR